MDEPISTRERLPELGQWVLFWLDNDGWLMGEWHKAIGQPTPWFGTEEGIAFGLDRVTFWMPLPPPPPGCKQPG